MNFPLPDESNETAGVPVGTESAQEQQNFTDPFGLGMEQPPTSEPFAAPESPGTAASPVQQPSADGPVDPKNDEKRYQYWQSEADKRQQKLDELNGVLPLVEYLKQNPEVMLNAKKGMQGAPESNTELKPKEFPPPPAPPKRPNNYNHEDALSDPDSPSGKYLTAQAEHQEKMNKYNYLQNMYTQRLVQEMADAQRQTHDAELQRQAQMTQIQSVRDYVTGHHQADPQAAEDFIRWASDEGSLTVDNLWALYSLQRGGPMAQQGAPQGMPQGRPVPQPSQTFQQTRLAQQVPSPMGVQPASGQDTLPEGERIMNAMIANHNAKNPW